MTVYIDIVFLGNSISALLLFLSVRVFYSLKGKWYRLFLSVALGGLYGVLNAVYPLYNLIHVVVLFFMTLIAWGRTGVLYNTLRVLFLEGVTVVAIVSVSNLFGINAMVRGFGIALIAKDGITALIMVMVYPVIIIINRLRQKYKRVMNCVFYVNDVEIKLKLLYDSGNLLTHKDFPVAVVDWRKFPDIKSYEDALLTAPERLVYQTVSSSGIMPLIKPEKAVFGGIYRDCYIGLTDRRFKGYAGVIGKID